MSPSALPSTTSSEASAAYPPQNSLQAALQNREAMDSLATVQLGEAAAADAGEVAHEGHRDGHDQDEAMRLRGGCFNLGLCGCPDCDCVGVPLPRGVLRTLTSRPRAVHHPLHHLLSALRSPPLPPVSRRHDEGWIEGGRRCRAGQARRRSAAVTTLR